MGKIILSEKAKKYEDMVSDLAKLHVLLIRYVERNTSLKVINMHDFDMVLQGGKMTSTYAWGIQTLKKYINQLCKNEKIIDLMHDLESRILDSDLKDMRFGINPQKRFTDLEYELNSLLMRKQMYMNIELKSLAFISEQIGVPVTTIKQACQSERLLNTKKEGKTWLAHLDECRQYWNIEKQEDNKLLFSEFKY